MPKRGYAEDTRGLKAKAQKAASAQEKSERSHAKKAAAESADWAKGSNKHKAGKDAKTAEKAAALRSKKKAIAEAEAADAEGLSKMKKSKGKNRKAEKKKKPLTAFQRQMIAQKKEKDAAEARRIADLAKGGVMKQQDLLKPNLNKERGDGELLEASSLEGALSVLDLAAKNGGGSSDSVDAHPERRQKAAFAKYKEREFPIMRAENKGLKKSQIDERIFKAWQKSDENPMKAGK